MKWFYRGLYGDRRGFTLVELLLVVAILAVLAFIAIPRIADTVRNARVRACLSNVNIIEEAVNRYHADQVAQGETTEVDLWPTADLSTATTVALNGAWGGVPTEFQNMFNTIPVCAVAEANGYQITWIVDNGRVTGFTVECTGACDY